MFRLFSFCECENRAAGLFVNPTLFTKNADLYDKNAEKAVKR